MSKIAIVFWSDTGNTEQMANLVSEGARAAGADVSVYRASEFNAGLMDGFDAIGFGCPSMGAEALESDEFEPMFEDCRSKLNGKRIGLFGSYGWGDGEWMRIWEAACQEDGAIFVADHVICEYEPDDEASDACKALGAALAA